MADAHPRVTGYAAPAKWLHWTMALIIIGLIPVGISLDKVPNGPTKDMLYDLHRSFGYLILLLAIVRVIVKRMYAAPPPASVLTRFERIASVSVHHLLYLLLFLVPVLILQITRARAEARVLEEHFGDDYRRYRALTWC